MEVIELRDELLDLAGRGENGGLFSRICIFGCFSLIISTLRETSDSNASEILANALNCALNLDFFSALV